MEFCHRVASRRAACVGHINLLAARASTRNGAVKPFAHLFACLLYGTFFGWSGFANAAPSTECPATQHFSVAAGGTVIVNNSNCSVFGYDGMTVLPSHGTVADVNPSNGNGTGIATYVNNGDGTLSDTFTLLDDSNGTITVNVTVGPAAPTITLAPTGLSNPAIGSAYSSSVTASGGTGPYTYAITAGTLPAGLSLASSGVLSGTSTAGGTFNFTVRATDNLANTGSRAYSMTISAPAIAITPSSLPAATVASAYSQSVTAGNGTTPYTYAISAGALPSGLTLSTGGTLSGTPTAGGSFNFTVR